MWSRRKVLLAGLSSGALAGASASPAAETLLRDGGVVVVMRHANAPGTFDPPGFVLGDCSTQRLLGEEGRDQARRIGAWFAARGLAPRQVRSSPWCRCLETGVLAFGSVRSWSALGSPYASAQSQAQADAPDSGRELRAALAAVPAGRFDVWVTHNFVIGALLGRSAGSGDAWVARADASGAPEALARLDIP